MKYYIKYKNGEWKVYIIRLDSKEDNTFLFSKGGITEFQDADARLYFNQLLEKVNFRDSFNCVIVTSQKFPNKESAEEAEKIILKILGEVPTHEELYEFITSGITEIRKYDHSKVQKAVKKLKELKLKAWANSGKDFLWVKTQKNSKGKQRFTYSLNETQESVLKVLDSKNIKYETGVKGNGNPWPFIYILKEGYKVQYFPTTGRWANSYPFRVIPKNHYYSKGIEDYLNRFYLNTFTKDKA
jgi:DNA-binding MarR family transcriptional regulator